MKAKKRRVVLVQTILLLVSAYSYYSGFQTRLIITSFLIYSSYLLASNFTESLLERLVFTPAAFITLSVTLLFVSNFLSLDFFMPLLFAAYMISVLKTRPPITLRDEKSLKYVAIIVVSAAIIHLLIYSKLNYQLIGTDISRFGILSKTFELKNRITPNLQPYDLPTSFFYFPAAYSVPLSLSFAELNPITSITLFSFLLNLCAIMGFYLFSQNFLNKKQAITSTLFYAFLFDHVLDYLLVRAVFSYAWGIYFFFIAAHLLLRAWREEWYEGLITITVAGTIFTHWYALLPLLFLFLALSSAEFARRKSFKKSLRTLNGLVKPLLASLLLATPFLLLFAPHIGDRTLPMNWAEHKVGGLFFSTRTLWERIVDTFLSHGAFMDVRNVFYALGVITILLVAKKLYKPKRRPIIFFYVYTTFFAFLLYQSLTFRRMIDFPKIVYPIALALLVDEHEPLILLLLLMTPFILFTAPYYYLNVNKPLMIGIDPVQKSEMEAFEFIKNLPKNSTIMIDGGGTGCIAGSHGSHGDRIFPLTEKKVFLFTNYCWADYNRLEFETRLSLYRQLSINVNDTDVLERLTNYYGVTHVYLGPRSLGLRNQDLRNSPYYEEVFNENKTSVFEITN